MMLAELLLSKQSNALMQTNGQSYIALPLPIFVRRKSDKQISSMMLLNLPKRKLQLLWLMNLKHN